MEFKRRLALHWWHTPKTRPTDERKINIYQKALNELVGIKFVNKFSGKFLIPDFQYTRSDSF